MDLPDEGDKVKLWNYADSAYNNGPTDEGEVTSVEDHDNFALVEIDESETYRHSHSSLSPLPAAEIKEIQQTEEEKLMADGGYIARKSRVLEAEPGSARDVSEEYEGITVHGVFVGEDKYTVVRGDSKKELDQFFSDERRNFGGRELGPNQIPDWFFGEVEESSLLESEPDTGVQVAADGGISGYDRNSQN